MKVRFPALLLAATAGARARSCGSGGPHQGWNRDERCPGVSPQCGTTRPMRPYGQPKHKSCLDFNAAWPLNSWSLSENSNGCQVHCIRLLARFVKQARRQSCKTPRARRRQPGRGLHLGKVQR